MVKNLKLLSFFFLYVTNSVQAQDALLDKEITLDKITGTIEEILDKIYAQRSNAWNLCY